MKKIVTEYARMWPREVWDVFDNKALVVRKLPELQQPGVYILYRDDVPYYVGKTTRALAKRLHDHSNKTSDRYFNYWNYFSFFVVPDPAHVDEVEGILIASMPTANSASPKIKQVQLPKSISNVLRNARRRTVAGS
jgi:hypothetical protein